MAEEPRPENGAGRVEETLKLVVDKSHAELENNILQRIIRADRRNFRIAVAFGIVSIIGLCVSLYNAHFDEVNENQQFISFIEVLDKALIIIQQQSANSKDFAGRSTDSLPETEKPERQLSRDLPSAEKRLEDLRPKKRSQVLRRKQEQEALRGGKEQLFVPLMRRSLRKR